MPNYWKQTGIPHKGWNLIDVVDVREDGQAEWETHYESCMMCGNEKIRYVHILKHPEVSGEYRVGCVCAEKMTGDYINPERRERDLRNRAERRKNWLSRNWKVSKKGNWYLKIDTHNIGVFENKTPFGYKCRIDSVFGTIIYKSIAEAKMGLFKKIEDMKEHGEW